MYEMSTQVFKRQSQKCVKIKLLVALPYIWQLVEAACDS